jgi:hypothetical protein
MVDCDGDKAVRRECHAVPSQASPDTIPPAPWDRRMNGRRGSAAGAASRAALPARKNGTMGGPIHCGSSARRLQPGTTSSRGVRVSSHRANRKAQGGG